MTTPLSLEPPDLTETMCLRCSTIGKLRIEMRRELICKPLGTYSVAGAQMKLAADEIEWPWMVCDSCGAESKGKR